jgi:hypothetical protein
MMPAAASGRAGCQRCRIAGSGPRPARAVPVQEQGSTVAVRLGGGAHASGGPGAGTGNGAHGLERGGTLRIRAGRPGPARPVPVQRQALHGLSRGVCPTAQASDGESALTLTSSGEAAERGLGVGTRVQVVPFQCTASVCSPDPLPEANPTARTSDGETALTLNGKPFRTAGLSEPGARAQRVPFQCRATAPTAARPVPKAQASVGESALTLVSTAGKLVIRLDGAGVSAAPVSAKTRPRVTAATAPAVRT